MAKIINIETSTHICSVSVAIDGENIFAVCSTEPNAHSSKLGVFIDEAITQMEKLSIQPDAIAVSSGPGSYTGLRIGISAAKGLCFGYGVPLIAIDTLKIIALTTLKTVQLEENHLICPMIDARRMEAYITLYNNKLVQQTETTATIIDETTFNQTLENSIVWFAGNGVEKCKTTLSHYNSRFVDNVDPLAQQMSELSEKAFKEHIFEDMAYYEPLYLKDFIITQSKKNLFPTK